MMEILFWLTAIILSTYTLLLVPAFVFAFRKQKRRKLFIPKTKISVLVPVRNEEKEIAACLQSLIALDYPENLFEIMIVDDHSDDKTKLIAEEFSKNKINIRVLDNNSIGKKSALTVGDKPKILKATVHAAVSLLEKLQLVLFL